MVSGNNGYYFLQGENCYDECDACDVIIRRHDVRDSDVKRADRRTNFGLIKRSSEIGRILTRSLTQAYIGRHCVRALQSPCTSAQ